MVERVLPKPVQVEFGREFSTVDLSTEHKKRVIKMEKRKGNEKGSGEKFQKKERRGKAHS